VLVVAQIAGALALLATAGLAVRSANALVNGPQGYEPRGVLSFDVTLQDTRYAEPEKRRGFVRAVEAGLAELPGVESVAATNALPGRNGFSSRAIEIEGQPPVKGQEPPTVESRQATPGLFSTLRLPLETGRGLEATDTADTEPIAVVSRAMAERFWPGQDPIGKRFRLAGEDGEQPWLRVVGVSGDVIQQWVLRRNAPTFYRPLAQAPPQRLAFAVRAGGDPEALAAAVRRAVAAVDADQPVYRLSSMRRAISQSTIGLQYVAAIMAAFGVLALVLAVGGVYGVMAYRVSRRTLEIGVRVALGASRADVLRLTLGQALRLSAIGLAIGAVLALGASRALGSALRGAVAFDAGVLALVTALLAAVAVIAALVPARRALAIDPARALRAE
jgi:putative ABC transport system permease protein